MGMRARHPVASEADVKRLPEVSWREVAKHNSRQSCWVIVHDVAYDMTDYIDKHPGGDELLLTFAGREATYAFESYHALSYEVAKEKLRFFAVARVTDSEFQRYPKATPFYDDVKKRVKAHFEEKKVDPKEWTTGFMHFMLMMLIAAASISVCFGVVPAPWWGQLFAAVVFGWIQALPLLHIMHDCSHGAFSHSPFLWDFVGKFTMDLYAGASMTAWHLQHVVGHHVWTNVFSTDPDLPPAKSGDPRYLVKLQEWAPMYKYQHLYLPLAYGVLGIKVRISDVQHAFFQDYAGPMRVRKHSTEWYAKWIAIKAMWLGWRVVLPIAYLGVNPLWFLVMFLISDMVTGWYLAFNFQVSHISDVADYPFGDSSREKDVCEDEWAVSQVRTSVDYSHGDAFMTWMCGALNYQTVHHLFPGISQYHYPAIAPVIQQVCKEHNVKYNCLPTFGAAFAGHINYLKVMGQKGQAAEFHMG